MNSLNWGNNKIFKLIEMFQEREYLWNTALDGYKDRLKKHEAWCEIANEFNLDKYIVEKKMRSLIGQFQREFKKFDAGVGDEETSKWFAFKKMMFLRDRYKPGASKNTEYEEKYLDDTEKEQGEDNENRDKREKAISKIRKRSRPRHKQDRTSLEALSLLKTMYDTLHRRDEFDVFGEHVAIKLRKLNNSHAKNTAQFHINNILYNADMGEYDWPSNNKHRSHITSGTSAVERSNNEDSNVRRDSTPGTSSTSESSNDSSTGTIDIKSEVSENPEAGS